MDRRSEPRFENYTTVTLRPLDHSELKLECVVVDISGAGMRIVAPESLPKDAIIGLEFTDQVVLANVCHAQPFGDKYALGAQRIHTVSKAAPPRKKSEIEQIRAAIEEFKTRKRAPSTVESDGPPALSEEDLTQLDRQLEEYFEYRQGDPEGPSLKRREDTVKRILDRINRIPRTDSPPEPKIKRPSLVQLSKVCAPEPGEKVAQLPTLVEKKPDNKRSGLPSWFTASLAKQGPHS